MLFQTGYNCYEIKLISVQKFPIHWFIEAASGSSCWWHTINVRSLGSVGALWKSFSCSQMWIDWNCPWSEAQHKWTLKLNWNSPFWCLQKFSQERMCSFRATSIWCLLQGNRREERREGEEKEERGRRVEPFLNRYLITTQNTFHQTLCLKWNLGTLS